MKSHFMERLIVRSTGKESGIFMRPAIAPDVVSETFHPPEREHVPLPITPSIPAEPEVSARDSPEASLQKLTSEPKQGTMPEEDSVSKKSAQSEATPKKIVPVEDKVEKRYTETKDIEPKEVTTRILTEEAKKESKQTKVSEDIKKDIQTSKNNEKQMMATKEGRPQLPRSEILIDTSSKVIKIDQKDRISREIAYKRIPSKSEYGQEPPQEITNQLRPIERVPTELAEAYTRRDRSIQEGKGLKRARDYSEPTVTVDIERVEVRAITPQKPPIKKEGVPALSLEEYLKQRREEG